MSDTEQDYTRERAALTRLANVTRLRRYEMSGKADAQLIERLRDDWYPPPRVRAVVQFEDVNGDDALATLYGDRWTFGHRAVLWIERETVARLAAAQQRADADGMVTEGEGLGDAVHDAGTPNSEELPVVTTAPSPAPAPTAPREWWVVQFNDGGLATQVTEGAARAVAGTTWAKKYAPEIVHVREVRPLTAAQVEALAQAMADAWSHVVAASLLPIRSTSTRYSAYMAEARAALAHLGIPVKEVG